MPTVVYAAQVHITTIGLAPHLTEMLRTLRRDPAVSTIHLWVNKEGGLPRVRELREDSRVDAHIHYHPLNGIYEQWNAALDWTERYDAEDRIAVVLNDDLTLPADCISDVLEKMLRFPHFALVGLPYEGSQHQHDIAATRGTYKSAGMGGFAWAAWPKRCGRVAPGYTWWFGDDDLVMRTLDSGEGVGIARGTPLIHEASYSSSRSPEVLNDIEADRRLYESHWG